MNQMSALDIAWIAGMVEGEGGFSYSNKTDKFYYPNLRIKSVDKEVVVRIQTITGVGTIYSEPAGRMDNPNNQEIFIWHLGVALEIIHFLCAIVSYGFSSEHRKIQILDTVEICSQILARVASGESYRRNIPPGGYNSKLTEDDVRLIRNDNRSYQAIAGDYPAVSGAAIGRLKRGETWKHVI